MDAGRTTFPDAMLWGSSEDWERAPGPSRTLAQDIMELHRLRVPPTDRLVGKAAFQQLTKDVPSGASPRRYALSAMTKIHGRPVRGQAIDSNVDAVALPEPGMTGVRLASVSPYAKRLFQNFKTEMLKPESEIDFQSQAGPGGVPLDPVGTVSCNQVVRGSAFSQN